MSESVSNVKIEVREMLKSNTTAWELEHLEVHDGVGVLVCFKFQPYDVQKADTWGVGREHGAPCPAQVGASVY